MTEDVNLAEERMPPRFLKGERVSLRPLDENDVDVLCAWFADREVVRYSLTTWQYPWSRSRTEAWLNRTLTSEDTVTFGVVAEPATALIGIAGIASISHTNRSGEYFILLGDKASWSQGYGTEVTRLVVDHGFAALNLNRISLTVSDVNAGATKAYERAGFTREGVLRQACFRDGEYHDKISMGLLRSEWRR